jgi:16S rRNA (adenine1518-N6/adenine1519-N6)-dimethyltransferase
VFAFEIEKKLQSYWQERRKTLKNVEIIWGNVLYQSELLDSLKTYKVIANLPYQITSAVIRLFLEQKFPPLTMVVMVQKEVAERICAAPGDMSILSVAVQYYAKPEYITTVPRSAFWPSPAVDSAIIKLQPLSTPNIDTDKNQLFKLVKAGFSSRRKVLRKNLEGYVSKENKSRIVDALRQLNLSSEVRAQELGVTEWIALVRLLS